MKWVLFQTASTETQHLKLMILLDLDISSEQVLPCTSFRISFGSHRVISVPTADTCEIMSVDICLLVRVRDYLRY